MLLALLSVLNNTEIIDSLSTTQVCLEWQTQKCMLAILETYYEARCRIVESTGIPRKRVLHCAADRSRAHWDNSGLWVAKIDSEKTGPPSVLKSCLQGFSDTLNSFVMSIFTYHCYLSLGLLMLADTKYGPLCHCTESPLSNTKRMAPLYSPSQ